MNHSIYQRNRLFWVRFSINGREIRLPTKETNERRAHVIAPRIIEKWIEKETGKQELRFGQLVVRYHNYAKLHKSSWKDDDAMLKVMLTFFKKETLLHEITPLRIEEFIQFLSNRMIGNVRTISKARINRYLTLLKTMFNRAIGWELFEKQNPVKHIKFFREYSRIRFFSQDEIMRLLNAAEKEAGTGHTPLQKLFPFILAFALFSGMRLGEILGLKWDDYRDGFFLLTKTKNGRQRYVPIRPELQQLLLKLPRSSPFVFDLPKRNSETIRKVWNTVKAKAGIEISARFHDTRHTNATMLAQAKNDPLTVKAILGHSSFKAFEVYVHPTNEMKMNAAMSINMPALPFGNAEKEE